MSEQASSTTQASSGGGGDIIARAGRYYRNTRFLLAIALVAYGIWNIHDGGLPFNLYKGAWAHVNDQARAQGFDKMPWSDMDIGINQGLGCGLPPLGILLLAWALRSSRGEFRLSGNTLSVPGLRPMQLEQIEAVDKTKWDRKGIAMVTYRMGNGKPGKFKLDDFVYQRSGIDEIFKRIEQSLSEPRLPKAVPAAAVVPLPPPPRPKA